MRLSEREVVETVGSLTVTQLRVWVREGWVAPAQGEQGPVFDDTDVARVRLVCQLKDDLDLAEDALPVVLSLVDQLHGLRRQLKALARAIDHEPEEVRERVRAALSRHGGR